MKTSICVAAFALTTACSDLGSSSVKLMTQEDGLRPKVVKEDPVPRNPDQPVDLGSCAEGFSYEGFGGTQLVVGRDEDSVGYDRDRVKPLTALRGEYARVLGKTPALLEQLSNTFGAVPPRWYVEPEASAVSLYSAMRVAFVGCLEFTNTTEYDGTLTLEGAEKNCTAFAHRFWSRNPAEDELARCVDVVSQKTNEEPNMRRKWAYGCASVLSSAGFLTY